MCSIVLISPDAVENEILVPSAGGQQVPSAAQLKAECVCVRRYLFGRRLTYLVGWQDLVSDGGKRVDVRSATDGMA